MNINKLKFYKILNIILCVILVFSVISLWPKKEKIVKNENIENNYYDSYAEYLFLGDSITNNYTLQKYYPQYPIINSGIGGDRTLNMLNNLDNRVFKYRPKVVIILAGINDLKRFEEPEYVAKNIEDITLKIKKKLPKCKIYIESIYPVNEAWKDDYDEPVQDTDELIKNIKSTNKKLKKICKKYNYEFLNVYDILEEEDILIKEYSNDGLHLNEEGYRVVTDYIKEHIFNKITDFKTQI